MNTLTSPGAPAVQRPLRRARGNWQWSQQWRNLFFLHWQVPAETIRRALPRGIELDLWDGAAWVSLVAFRLENVRLRGLPPLGRLSNFLELNVRTYVRFRGEPGVYFLSMYADSALGVVAARWLTPLPYRHAAMSALNGPDGWRWNCAGSSRSQPPILDGVFRPQGEEALVAPDSLDGWLLERYQALVPDRQGRLRRMAVEHPPWLVRDVSCEVTAARCQTPDLDLNGQPLRSHFSSGVDALVWSFERLD